MVRDYINLVDVAPGLPGCYSGILRYMDGSGEVLTLHTPANITLSEAADMVATTALTEGTSKRARFSPLNERECDVSPAVRSRFKGYLESKKLIFDRS